MATVEAAPAALQIQHDSSVVYRYLAPRGHTLEDCRRPDYWRHNVRDLALQRYVGQNPWHRIEIIADDGSWEAELRVVSVDGELVTTRVLRAWHAEPKRKAALPAGYRVEHLGGQGWRVLDSNAVLVGQKFATEDEALLVATDHARRAKGG